MPLSDIQRNNLLTEKLITQQKELISQQKTRNYLGWAWFILFLLIMAYIKYNDVFNNTIRTIGC